MSELDRVVKRGEFMNILGCQKSEFYARYEKMPNFPRDTGLYIKMRTWWLSDVVKFIEELKKHKAA